MKYNTLGRTDLKVSDLCLGSMTWGTQNTEPEGHAQIDMALDHGINFIDTAEIYPVNPVSRRTAGDTETIIGNWFAKNGRRDQVILATKIAGEGSSAVRDGGFITRASLTAAIETSLARLQTDYVDLYQFHWPNRGGYMFRRNWTYDPSKQNRQETLDNMLEVLETLQDLVNAGKIRHFGLSNESVWGTAQYLRLSDQHGLPRVQSIQNEYSLLCRLFDTDWAELSHNEDVGLLAYSPLATGLLTDKYKGGTVVPPGSRLDIGKNLGGRVTENAWRAVDAYKAVADKHGLNLVQMSIAWCNTRPFMTSAIIGATSTEQLAEILGASDLTLSREVLDDITAAHRANPMPY